MKRKLHIFKKAVKDVILLHYYRRRLSGISSFLESGVYIIANKKRTIFKQEINVIDYLASTFGFNHETYWAQGYFIETFGALRSRVKINNAKLLFSGHIALFSNKQKKEKQFGDVKIFDVKRKMILTSFRTDESYQKRRRANDYFSAYFPIPTILKHNDVELFTIEQMVDFFPYDNLQNKDYLRIADKIFSLYTAYYQNIHDSSAYNTTKPSSFSDYNILHPINRANVECIRAAIDASLLNIELPVVYQHGDLSLQNILFANNDKIYIIDWEHASSFSFLYDVMWFWQNEAINRDNYYMIEHYLSGGCDAYMAKLFSCFKMKYLPGHRLSYFLIMLTELIWNRVLIKNSTRLNSFLSEKVMPMIENTCKIDCR